MFRLIFLFVIASEGGLYLWDYFSPQMMATETWTMQEFRLTLVLLSTLAFFTSYLWKTEEA